MDTASYSKSELRRLQHPRPKTRRPPAQHPREPGPSRHTSVPPWNQGEKEAQRPDTAPYMEECFPLHTPAQSGLRMQPLNSAHRDPAQTLPRLAKKSRMLRSQARIPRMPQCAVNLGRKAQTARGDSLTIRIAQLLSGTPHPYYQPPRGAPSLQSQPIKARFGIRDPSAPTGALAASRVAARHGLRAREPGVGECIRARSCCFCWPLAAGDQVVAGTALGRAACAKATGHRGGRQSSALLEFYTP